VRYERVQYVGPWIAAFVDMLTAEWRRISGNQKATSLLLALDEVANVAPAASIPSLVTAGGGDGIQALLGFQEPSQATRRWQEEGKTVLNAASHTVIFPGIADRSYIGDQAELLGKVVRHDKHVEVRKDVPIGLRLASPERLIAERYRVERAVSKYSDGWKNRLSHVAASREATKIWVERTRLGILSRVPEAPGAEGVLREILFCTTVAMKSERRDRLEVADLFRGKSERSVLIRSGNGAEFRELPRHYEDATWRAVLA
jgi:hypothetical protein